MLIPREYSTFLALAYNLLAGQGLGEDVKGRRGITLLSLRREDPQPVVALPHPEAHQAAGSGPSDNKAWLLLLILTFPPLNSTGKLIIILFLKDTCVTQSSRELGTETNYTLKKIVNICIFQKENKSTFGAFRKYLCEGSFPS